MPSNSYDAIVIGSGPNGLAAAITMAQAGHSVVVYEAEPVAGGGARSAELTLPGFVHDICSAVHPLGIGSPFFRSLPLADYGLEWIQPAAPLAHPFDDGTAVVLHRSVDETAAQLDSDGRAYQGMLEPFVARWHGLDSDVLGPLRLPRHPLLLARFGLRAVRPARSFAEKCFRGDRARALLGGLVAHSMLPLEHWSTMAIGLVLGIAGHALGWPIPRGGAQNLSGALVSYLRTLGGEVLTGRRIRSLQELPRSRVVLCDLTPRQLLKIAGDRLSARYQRRLERYHYGMAAFKMDWALAGPVPWKAPESALAGTVHLGGTLEEIAASESAAWRGEHADSPFVLVAQPSLFDPSRTPEGKHTLWGYCHVPHGSSFDMADRIERQIERFAPGFRDLVLARSILTPAQLEQHNANLVGGDIGGGSATLSQLLFRPTAKLYSTSLKGLYLCSASTPPGAGVHGMCGYFAARRALRELF